MAGRSLDWFLDQSSENPDRKALFREMDAFVGKSTPGAHGISFFPYLAGQISPTINHNRKASFLGESKASTRFDKYQAVMEGASFAIAESFKQVIGWTGPPQFVGVTGSGADSLVWVQMLANILQVDLSLTDASSEGRGAAVFAAMALKEYSGLEEAIEQMVHVSRIVSPERDKTDTYAALFGQWQKRNKLAGCLSAPSESTNTPTCK
jgi:sugar (pentulose or hexulose) kinase